MSPAAASDPLKSAWRAHVGQIAWPTVAMTVAVVAAVPAVWWAVAWGLPRALGTLAVAACVYVAFTPMHEAAHGNVGGNAKRAWIDTAVGWACSLLFLAPFPAFKAVHLRHHGAVNHPERDPDIWVKGQSMGQVIWRCWTILPHYYWMFLGPMASPANRRARVVSAVTLTVVAAAAGVASLYGWGWDLLTLWLLPAWFASGWLALAFDWLPHHPHGDQGRWTNARIVTGWAGRWWMLGQDLHLLHHLWPRVPWYRYRTLYGTVRPGLVEKGCRL